MERMSFPDFLKSKDFDIKIACVERSQDLSFKDCLRNIENPMACKIAILIGPEGGFSASELSMLQSHDDIKKVSLGKLILRAETAVICALSNIIYELEHD